MSSNCKDSLWDRPTKWLIKVPFWKLETPVYIFPFNWICRPGWCSKFLIPQWTTFCIVLYHIKWNRLCPLNCAGGRMADTSSNKLILSVLLKKIEAELFKELKSLFRSQICVSKLVKKGIINMEKTTWWTTWMMTIDNTLKNVKMLK